MGIKYLWDTNTVIYYLHQQLPVSAERFIDGLANQYVPCISVITEIELLCWRTDVQKNLNAISSFLGDMFIVELNGQMKLKTVEIRKYNKIKLPDAIIAATALVYDYTLISRNTSDFKSIGGLKLINPWEL